MNTRGIYVKKNYDLACQHGICLTCVTPAVRNSLIPQCYYIDSGEQADNLFVPNALFADQIMQGCLLGFGSVFTYIPNIAHYSSQECEYTLLKMTAVEV